MRLTLPLAVLATAFTVNASLAQPDLSKPRPMFITLPNNHAANYVRKPDTAQLPQWNGSFTDHLGQTVNFTMVGGDPATTNTISKVRILIVPIKMVFGPNNGNATFDPLTVTLPNGQSLIQNVLASPLLTRSVNFQQGGVNLGTAQYIDAFQRGNFWSSVSTNRQYHVIFSNPTVLGERTIRVPVQDGNVQANPFGSGNVGTMYVNDFDTDIQAIMAKIKAVNPGVLPLFLTYDTYLTEVPLEACCIGGYHSAIGSQPGGQTYAYTTYVDSPGAFSQDVSAMSHELGEWMDDPFVDNSVNCADNQLMEDGDPLENNANYGAFPYTVNGFTYNLQSLVFIGYFGAPTSTSVNSWLSFQNDEASVCPGQGTPAKSRPVFSLH